MLPSHMRTKFVMFSSGIALFSEFVQHNGCFVLTSLQQQETAIAAGFASVLDKNKEDLSSLVLYGSSVSLGIDAKNVYDDWKEKIDPFRLPIWCVHYSVYEIDSYFLPFKPISKFATGGVGEGSLVLGRTLHDVIRSIQ